MQTGFQSIYLHAIIRGQTIISFFKKRKKSKGKYKEKQRERNQKANTKKNKETALLKIFAYLSDLRSCIYDPILLAETR